MKLRTRVKKKLAAPGGDLSNMKTTYVVQVLVNRKWTDHKSFDLEETANLQAAELDGLEVDVS